MPLRPTYANQLNDPLTAAVTNNTFTGPQNLIKTGAAYSSQPCIIPLNYLKAGTTIRTEAWGTFSTTLTPTLVFGVYYAATPLAVNVAFTTASGAVTLPWHLRTVTHIRSAAVPSAVVTITQGELWYGTTLTATTQIPIPGIALATTNIDNSANGEWSIQATYSASSASNIVVLHAYSIEELTQL
jgi:phosphoribosylcarboxyaminoimidazole (NCAIR) mutase